MTTRGLAVMPATEYDAHEKPLHNTIALCIPHRTDWHRVYHAEVPSILYYSKTFCFPSPTASNDMPVPCQQDVLPASHLPVVDALGNMTHLGSMLDNLYDDMRS
jgi:hypothetical protein